jgi:glyoxylase-like metal-dependent hydrolase (beta-lactamase superfamily II)/rhodanese-related sulfurtransferase
METSADATSRVAELEPAAFEDELRRGDDVVVVDTRTRADFASWHVSPGRSKVINVPEAELVAHPEAALAGIPHDARLRIICNAGNASRRAAAALMQRPNEVRSVRGGLIGWSRVLQHDELPLAGPIGVVQFRREARGCLSYLLYAGDEALVVDPARGVQPYLDEAARRGARITRVLDTHVHADHLSGAHELARRTGATLHLSRAALARGVRFAAQVEPVDDGDRLAIGDETVQVVALPGHTSDMNGIQIGQEALIGGDSLFADSVARPDLESGDEGASGAARLLHRTLRDRVASLPGSMLLLPCHYSGGRLEGPLAPTLEAVRDRVPELALDEDAFVARVLEAMPPRPANYLAIIAVNLGDGLDDDSAARLEIGANNCAANAAWTERGI